MLVVPGAPGSSWPAPHGADAVWSKSAGRLLMGDLGSEGETAQAILGSPLSQLPHSRFGGSESLPMGSLSLP